MKIVMIEPLGVDREIINKYATILSEAGHEFVQYDNRVSDDESLISRGRDADVIIITNLPFKKSVIEKCLNLKMISVAFTGVDHIDLSYCKERGITVSNAAGYSTNAVAELAIGLMVGVYRKIVSCDKRTRESGTKVGLVGHEMSGKKIGVLGTGAIGSKVIEIALAFSCEVLAFSRSKKQILIDQGVQYVSLDEIMRESDIITLHMPLNETTKGMINAEQIALMKKESILINTARGPIIDNDALAEALKSGKIAGAGIDVFETEPPIATDHALMEAPNTLLTPHVAFATKESLIKRADIVFDNIVKWQNKTPINVV